MGLDKIYNTFYRLFGGNEDMEENKFNKNFKYIPAETILIDGNFIIYQIFYLIEKDINDILKAILAVPHNSNRDNLIKIVKNILTNSPLKNYQEYFEEIFYQDSLEKMIEMLQNKTLNLEHNDNQIKNIISDYYIDYIEKKITNLHFTNFIKNIYLIFDGIPSGFKIVEQRRRRFKNYLESIMRKRLLNNNIINSTQNLSVNGIRNEEFIFDYGLFVKNMITLNKSFGPSSDLFKIIGKKLKIYLNKNYPKITYWYSGVDEKGEADFKIVHLCKLIDDSNIVIHCSDFDFIVLGSRLQNQSKNKFYLIRHFNSSYVLINFLKLNDRILVYLSNKYKIKSDKKIIDDFNFIINLFGNDYIPCLNELNFDNNFINLIDIIGNNLWKNNKFILNCEKINWDNLKIVLINIDTMGNLLLKSHLKNKYFCNSIIKYIPNNITSFYKFTSEILENYWKEDILNLTSWDELFQKDIRLDIIQKYFPLLKNELFKLNLIDIKTKIKNNFEDKLPINLKNSLKNILKPYYTATFGLKLKESKFNFSDNIYDNLYYFYYTKSKDNINHLFPLLENRNELTSNIIIKSEKDIVKDYLKTLNYINYKFYHPMSYTLFFYQNYTSPPINLIINLIDQITNKDIISDIITDEIIDYNLHLILISPNKKEAYPGFDKFFNENINLIILNKNEDIENNSLLINKFNNYKNLDIFKIKQSWERFIVNLKNNLLNDKDKILLDKTFDTNLLL